MWGSSISKKNAAGGNGFEIVRFSSHTSLKLGRRLVTGEPSQWILHSFTEKFLLLVIIMKTMMWWESEVSDENEVGKGRRDNGFTHKTFEAVRSLNKESKRRGSKTRAWILTTVPTTPHCPVYTKKLLHDYDITCAFTDLSSHTESSELFYSLA